MTCLSSQLCLVFTLFLCISALGAPATKALTEAKDEIILVEIHQDLQSASESPVAVDLTKTVVSTTTTVSTSSSSAATSSAPTSTRAPVSGSTVSTSASDIVVVKDMSKSRKVETVPLSEVESDSSTFHLLDEFMEYGGQNLTSGENGYKLGYTVNEGNLKKFRYEERTPEGAIVGEFGFHKNDGVIRGVRYSAEPGVHPKVLYEALVKFFTL
ncbi:hypothetical protein HPB47_028114 [Ixodes persulcatus]|uniref:Uncharacterized protein n=1 Tax=Ixodes persulcatus TaxID=34615 RepID=A0AC60PVI3_IXOPE|nr:hypothetical protein HPB47_028114 [Ixodes persulcatus]